MPKYTLEQKPYFHKKFTKLIKRNKLLTKRFNKAFATMEIDPQDPSLGSHKVDTVFGEVFSSCVTGDIRIIWQYSEEGIDILYLLDAGRHEGGKKVYK